MSRRAFRLPEMDETFLDGLGVAWDTIQEGGVQWLILTAYRLPQGYDHAAVDIAIQISAGYPAAALDMAYLTPPVRRRDGRPINCTESRSTIDGRVWQMWSRHRTPENPWIHGEDDLASHVHYMDAWLAAEFERA
ncbi:MAG: hypothetical protein DCF29_00115 [Alphaproteobacteria bacterium]|uniref:E2/UBC family protein n=1 Tax=Brevundimonas sp. BAL3 TaxID=391600 RepID=UPI00017EBEE1|nr:E2/UBC family protein [Brevundimonas sp. BAL3]EDX79648.1 hypothetical protein BBAL3_805 [Brevundimonas sp. BAL3]PZO09055.1 MAG: hypothetical protein DCF29_00115 [Alphaproteobacteria bacterium]